MNMNLAMTIVMGLMVGVFGYVAIDAHGMDAFVSCAGFGCWFWYTLNHQRQMILESGDGVRVLPAATSAQEAA